MSRTPRSEVFEPAENGVYHVYNYVVRRCFLCGKDPVSGKDFSYRRKFIVERLRQLADFFAIDVMAHSILSNHFHIVVRNRPDLVKAWDDREVARRWCMICPEKRAPDLSPLPPTEARLKALLADKEELLELRSRLSNPSWLMRQVCQYIARRCNAEDNQRGRFFGDRFQMKRLLDEAGVLACMAYVDLNPINAGMCNTLEGYAEVSIGERMRSLDDLPVDTAEWLAPLSLAGETDRQSVRRVGSKKSSKSSPPAEAAPVERLGCLPMELEQYVELLQWLAVRKRPELAAKLPRSKEGDRVLRGLGLDAAAFATALDHYERQFFTVVGCPVSTKREAKRRNRRWLQSPGRHALRRRNAQPAAG